MGSGNPNNLRTLDWSNQVIRRPEDVIYSNSIPGLISGRLLICRNIDVNLNKHASRCYHKWKAFAGLLSRLWVPVKYSELHDMHR